jgi:cell division protein FtsB
MSNFQAGSNRSRGRFSPRTRAWLAIIVLAAICFLLGRATWGIYRKNEIAEANKESALRRLGDLKIREKNIVEKMEKLSTKEGVEEKLREALPVAKDGEHVITIIDEPFRTEGSSTVTGSPPKAGFWSAVFKGW